MPYIRANGVDLYHEIAGEGPDLLFISGTGADLRTRPNVFDGLLPRSFRTLAYDQRGLGRTRAPDRDCRMVDYADDAASLMAESGWGPTRVFGVSFGGMVAQELAIRHPELVTRLVLACTSSGGAGGSSYPLHELEELAPRARAERYVEISDTRRDARWRRDHPERWERYVDLTQESRRADRDRVGAARQLEARRHHDTHDRLARIEAPTLVVGGRFDGIAPPSNVTALAAGIPDASVVMFDGGHLFLVQDRTAMPFVIDWLSA